MPSPAHFPQVVERSGDLIQVTTRPDFEQVRIIRKIN